MPSSCLVKRCYGIHGYEDHYIEMVGDLESQGYSVSYNTIEIGSLGHYTNLPLKALCNFASELLTKSECSKLLNSVAKISISCSHTKFHLA